jgi:uncharacterized protein
MGRILNWVMVWVVVLGVFFAGGIARGAEVIPPAPGNYFNDYAHVTSPAMADELNVSLEDFEKTTSNQIWVVIYPKMQTDSDIADYTVRVAQAWRVGNKAHSNGVVLFVFVQDRKAFIQVGYGLEGALPDATCKQIVDQEITPQFKTGDYDTGVQRGVLAILAATKGEYKGTGQTDDERMAGKVVGFLPCIGSAVGVFLLFGLFLLILHNMGGTFYRNHARSIGFFENTYLFIFSMALNIVSSGGSSGSSSGGGFSGGGGGSFGGGGAGGSW